MSGDRRNNFCERAQHVKLSKKISFHFAKFAIHELLIIEDRRISVCGRVRPPQPDARLSAWGRQPPRCWKGCEELYTNGNDVYRCAALARVRLQRSYSAALAITTIFY